MGDDKVAALVCDSGSGMVKAGVAGDEALAQSSVNPGPSKDARDYGRYGAEDMYPDVPQEL